uniref:PHD and RING finger domain-containing protein 1 n=1 Tax=Cacopsylla melanoneura TaxID=428564 RepID=A0A8D9B2I4_9HEMI
MMDRDTLNERPTDDSESTSPGNPATMKKKKKLKQRAVNKRFAGQSSGDSSSGSEDIVSRPLRSARRPNTSIVSSESEDDTGLVVRSDNPANRLVLSTSSDSNVVFPSTSRCVQETPSSSSSSSPIMLPHKNRTTIIGSDTSTSTSSDLIVNSRRGVVRQVVSESPSTSSDRQTSRNGQPMSTDDDEGPQDFLRTNRLNKLSSTESSEDEDCPSCAICLSSLANRIAAQISGCSHEFHNTCILKWSERTNTCPIDRSKFNKITVKNKEGKIVKVTEIDDKNAATADDDEQPFPDEAINCVICGSAENEEVLLLCDGCNRGFHIFCLTPPLDRVPEGNWICEHCSPVITLTDSIYFNDELDISIEDYSDNSNQSDMSASSNEMSDDPNQPSTSTRPSRRGRYQSASTLTVSVSSRNQNLLRNTRVRHTTITIKQTRKRKKRRRRGTRRSRRNVGPSTVSSRSRIMAAAIAKINSAACQDRGNTETRHREKTIRSEPGRPRLSLFSSDNFDNYYNPESDGEDGGLGGSGDVAVTARSRFPTPRLMDRKAAVARLINTNRRPRVAPRVTVPSATSSASSVNVLDDIMGMMEVENKKKTGSIPIKKDGTFSIPEKVDVNSDKNKEKVTETPGYPGSGVPNRGRGYYNSPGGGGQHHGARHQAGVFSSRGASPQFSPRFSPFPTGRNNSDGFQSFRTPQPRFRSNAPRRFPSRRSLPASLLMEPEAEQEEHDEDVDIYGDIDSGPLVVNNSAVGTLEPPPQPPAALFDLGPPPEPPAALLNIGSPEEGPSDEEKGLIIDDNEYDPADPCDSPETIENPPSISSDSSSDGLGAIPIPEAEPPVHSCAPRPGNIQSDSEEDCPNTSLYSSTSLAFARNKSKNNGDSERENDQESPVKPSPTNENNSIGAKSGPIRFSIGSKHVLAEPAKKIDLFSDDDDDESNSNDAESKEENHKNENEEQTNSEKDEEVATGVVNYPSDEDQEMIETLEENVSQDSEMEAKDEDKLSNGNDMTNSNNSSKTKQDEDKDSENEGEELSEEFPLETDKEASEHIEANTESPKDNSDEMSPKKLHADAAKSLEEEIFGSEKGEENEVDKDEVSTQGEEILDLNTENLQGVTDATVHEGSLQDTEEKEEDEEQDDDDDARAKSDSYNALDGLDVDPVSDSEYGSLSDAAEVDEAGKIDKKKKKKRKNTDREEGEIVEPKKKDRKKDKDDNNENSLGEKKSKKKKDKEFVELSPLQEKTLNNNKDNQDQEPGESVSWKKLSKNTKDRNYRDKDDIKGRKKKEGRKELERYNVRKIVGEKAFIRKDEFGRDISVSRSKSPSFGRSPRRRSRSRKRSPSRDRSKSPGRKNKKRRSRSKSLDRFRKRSLSRSPPRPRKRSRSPSLQKVKDRKIQKRGRSRSRSRRRSRTPKRLRSRSRSKPKKRSRSRDKGKGKLKKDKGGDNLKGKDIKKRKKRPRSRSWSKTRKSSRSPRGKSPFDFSSTSISRSPSPAPPATFRKSRSWSRDKNLTVIVPNTTNKKKDKKKSKENKRRKHKDDHSPTLSKEVFTSGDNILVSVNFAHAEKNVPETTAKVDKVKPATKRSKKDIQAMKAAKVKEIAAKAKPVAIIDLDVSPFRERTPSPKEVIVLCDSDSDIDVASAKANEMKAISSGPKTPPEPHIKFSINSKNQAISTISNPLMDIDDKQGPNTPPDPPSPGPTSPYDPFDPTKSRSPSPVLQSAPNDSIELKTPNDNMDKNQLELLKPAATPSKDSTQSPSKVISVNILDDNNQKQDDKLVTSSMSSTLQSSLPIYTPAMSNSNGRNNINGAEAMEDILNIDSDGVYSPGSSLGDDLFDPPKKSPPPSSVNKKFDSLFVPKNSTSAKSIPYEPKQVPVSGTPKKSAAPKYTPTKTKSSKLDEDQLKILDEVPSSAVEMQVKYKYLKKLNRQERVVEEVKHVLKPHYNKKHVTKEQYKDILRKSVPKICHNKSGEINPSKIHSLIEAYVKKYRIMNKKRTGGNIGNSVVTNNNNTNNNINSKKTKTMWN